MNQLFKLSIVLVLMLSFTGLAQDNWKNDNSPKNPKGPNFITNSVRSNNNIRESFEGTTFPPSGWAQINVSGGTGWARIPVGTTPVPGFNGGEVTATPDGNGGSAMAYMDYNLGGATSNDNWLVTLQLLNITANDSLSFWLRKFGNYADNLDVKISTTVNNDASAFNVTVHNFVFAAADSGWVYYSYPIGSLVPAGSNIYIGFREHVLDNNVDGAALFVDLVKAGPDVGPGLATNPNPVNNATNVDIDADLSWSNPGGATSVAVYFGSNPGSLSSVYSGSLISTWDPGTMAYNTHYYWRIDETDGTGITTGNLWSFTTESDPNIVAVFTENFESGLGNWTVTNLGGTCDWQIFNSTTWQSTSLPTLPGGTGGQWLGANSDGCGVGTTMNTLITMNAGIDLSQYQRVDLIYDSDFRIFSTDIGMLDISVDGGNVWTNLRTLSGASVRNEHVEVNISSFAALKSDVRFRMSYSGAYDYWWCLDNIIVNGSDAVPVELTSFAGSVVGGKVNLNWSTATETNNYGFDVERKVTGQEFAKVGFVAGFGTTTEARNYNFVDNSVTSGNYTYRLKQVDLDGTSEYSNEVEVSLAPSSYSLDQNYPNPFNPSTKINFSLASDSKVTLKIFDVLGQEVTTLINGSLSAGIHNLNFDASGINSGVYFYTIEATGVDGTNFKSTKKMMLTK